MARTERHNQSGNVTRAQAQRRAQGEERPRHPTGQAVVLLVGVTALIVLLALFSSLGRL